MKMTELLPLKVYLSTVISKVNVVFIIQADEREQKARDFMRAEMRYHKAVEDLKTKQLQIQDHQKKHQEMQIK